MEKGKAREQPNHVIQNKGKQYNDATRRREKRKNNPTSKIAANKQIIKDATRRREKQMNNPTLRINKPRTNQQPHGRRWWTVGNEKDMNEPETTWETLVDMCDE